ncbi:MAG TPA: hypothetical protein VMR92_11535 [Gemmatimonadales bacterium]|nr:hypothetical protein [Gemmatimonadales bacterium]
MDLIRPFQRDDIPAVVELFRWAFHRNGDDASVALEPYFEHVFFENPWYDEELPSFVHVADSGGIDGFIGVQPKRLRFRGRRVRVIAATKLMASPTATPLVASRLVRRVLAGPQDLLFTDISNDAGRRIFEALGGVTIRVYCLKWQRLVRPARHGLSWLRARGVPNLITQSLRPLGWVADAMLASRSTHNGCVVEDLPFDVLAKRLPELLPSGALQPEYDERWLAWLLGLAQQSEPERELRRRLVRDERGEPAGWFLYFVAPGGAADVLQLVARKDASTVVFDALLADAWSAGAAMVSGRLEPSMVREMSARHCVFRQADHWTLAQTRDPEILATIGCGGAFLSRLEGEW